MASSPDLRFFASLAVGWDGGEDDAPIRNLRLGILGFFASSSRRLQVKQMK